MKRRILLQRLAALGGVSAVAGCLNETGKPGDGGAGGENDDGPKGATVTSAEESDGTTSTPTKESDDNTTTPTQESEDTTTPSAEESEDTTSTPTEESDDTTNTPTEESEDTTTPSAEESDDTTTTPTEESEDTTTTPTEESDDTTSTPTETVTPEPTPRVASKSIETTKTRCKQGAERASVSFESAGLTVDGAIESPDPCHEAMLEAIEYDPDTDRLTVTVGVQGEGGVCQSCVGLVNYHISVDFDDGIPGQARIEHVGINGEKRTITKATS